MQLILHLKNKQELSIPLGYNYQLSSAVYALLAEDAQLGDFIHNEGFVSGTGRHKLFTFSQLEGEHRIEGKNIVFTGNISFEVRSLSERFIGSLKTSALEKGTFRLFDRTLEIGMIEVYDRHLLEPQVNVKLLSPVAASVNDNGKTLYFSPEDERFEEILNINLYHKFTAAYGDEPPAVLGIGLNGRPRKTVTRIKGIWVTAYFARLTLTSHPEVIDFLYQTGLGSKNSQGFGMFKPL